MQLKDLLEPGVSELPGMTVDQKALLSIAISVKAIHDVLSSEELPPALRNVNAYGENLAVAIQEGIVRGTAGISQYRG